MTADSRQPAAGNRQSAAGRDSRFCVSMVESGLEDIIITNHNDHKNQRAWL